MILFYLIEYVLAKNPLDTDLNAWQSLVDFFRLVGDARHYEIKTQDSLETAGQIPVFAQLYSVRSRLECASICVCLPTYLAYAVKKSQAALDCLLTDVTEMIPTISQSDWTESGATWYIVN